jgi:PAS domain S-box-containing protein
MIHSNTVLFHAARDLSGLKMYAGFLKENFFEQAAEGYLQLLESVKVPLLEHFAGLGRDEYNKLIRDSFLLMLNQLAEGKGFDGAKVNIDLWKNNQFPGVPRHLVQVTDFVKVYSIRKQLLIKMMHLYSTDAAVLTEICTDLEMLYIDIQEYAFNAYVEVQKQLIQEQKNFSDSLIDTNQSCIFAYDKEFCITAWNRSIANEFGISREEALGRPVLDVLPSFKKFEPYFLKVLKGGPLSQLNLELEHRRGICEMHINPQYNAEGALLGAAVNLHEISHLKEIEQKLKEYQEELEVSNEELKEGQQQLEELNEELSLHVTNLVATGEALEENRRFIQSIADATPDVIMVADLKEAKPVYINRTIFTLLGYSYDEAAQLGEQNAWARVHKEDTDLKAAFFDVLKAAKDKEVHELRLRLWHKHGFWSTLLIRASVFRRAIDGTVAEVIALVQDMSAQVQAEQELLQKNDELARAYKELKEKEESLRELNARLEVKVKERTQALEESAIRAQDSEKQLRLIANALPALVSYIDKGLQYRFVNKAYQDWFGIDAETIIGEHIEDVIGRKAFQSLQPHINKALAGLSNQYEGEVMYKLRGTRYVNVQYIPDFDNDGQVKGYIALVLDMSENIKARRELADKNKQLTKINIDLDNFIYTASHDLKSPIANLEGLIAALNKKLVSKVDTTEDTLLEMIKSSVDKFKKTINDLTDITKAQKAVNEQTDFILFTDIMQDVLSDVEPLIAEADASIKVDFKVPGVKYARKNLRSILYNLVGNAIKYRSPDRKAEVTISSRPANGYILLTVQDNGLGIDPGQQHKLFTMFKRLHSHVEGTGIGLYIIKRIIDNNGGFIELDSQPGIGSTFSVYFKWEED